MDLNRGIERLILLLSILVGTTIVVMTAQSDYTLGGSFHSSAEIILGHLFLWTSGFAGVWVLYGAAIFLVKGFNNVTLSDTEETIVTEINYHPLPEKKKPIVQKPPVILSWKEQIDRVRRASSRQRIRLVDSNNETKTGTTLSGSTVTGDKIKFHCRFCSQRIVIAKKHAGKRGQCMKCKKILLIPGAKPRVAIGTGMSAVSQVLAKAKRQAESRKAAWDNIQAELITGGRHIEEKAEVKAEVEAEVKEEKLPAQETISEKAKEAASVIDQVKAEAKAKAKELTDMLEQLKIETEEKIRAQANAAAQAVAAEILAQAETDEAVSTAKPKPTTKPKAKAKAKVKAKAKAKPKAKAKAKPKAKTAKPKSIDIKELVQKAGKTKKRKTVKA